MARHKRRAQSQPGQPPAAAAAQDGAAGRLRPWLSGGVAALFVVAPLMTGEGAASRGDGLPGVMLWIVLGAAWAIGAAGQRRFTFRFGWIDAAVVLLVAWHSLIALWTVRTGSPRPAVNMLWIWVGFGLSFLLARQLITGRREIRAMLAAMVAVAVAIAVYALYQRYYELPASWEAYIDDPIAAMRAAGVNAAPGSPEASVFEKRLFTSEPSGTFALANSLAGYLAPWLVVAAGILFSTGLTGWRRYWTAAAALLAAAAIAVGLAWTKSRSAYLAVVAGLPAAWWTCRAARRPSRWVVAAGVVVVATVLSAGLFAARELSRNIFDQALLSLGYRLQYWQSSLAMIADHPLGGCGPGQFQNAYTAYMLPTASEAVADPHNFLLEVWATAGTPAVLALLGVLAVWAYTVVRRRNVRIDDDRESSPPQDAVPQVLGGAAVGFLAAWPLSLVESVPTSLMAIALGLPAAAVTVATLYPWIERGRLPNLLPPVGVAVLLVNLLAAGGIGYPGVAGTLWLLLAVGLGTVEDRPEQFATRPAALALAAVIAVMGVTCYATAYRPVLDCRGQVVQAGADPARAERHLLRATEADPLAARPWNQLAETALTRLSEAPAPAEAFDRLEHEFLRRAPNSAAATAVAADGYWRAYEQTRRRSFLHEAVELYQRAVELYPTNAVYRGRLAVAFEAAGDQAGFAREATRALELDAQTPHADRKLPDKLRGTLQRSIFQREVAR